MLGWRGASRYYHPAFTPAFALECEAIKRVRKTMGLVNAHVMIPFCRTPNEGQKVLDVMASHGLSKQHDPELRIYVMCEIPSNVILADEFLKIFDGMSIGSNDLTQLTVGIDRDGSKLIRSVTNEDDPSVRELIIQTIERCRANGKYVGICGQAPSDIPGFAEFLVDHGIESISLNPDTVIATTERIYRQEQKMKPQQMTS
jgi:pyruvate,water dikinase